MSAFAVSKSMVWLFFFGLYPIIALAAAAFELQGGAKRSPAGGWWCELRALYVQHLLEPRHWFGLWRMNCTIVAEHSRISKLSGEYAMEEKGLFLLEGQKQGIPVSPFLSFPSLIVKHRAIEGGMGIHFFENFSSGGDWIIQPRLHNSEFLRSLLPADAPLSTLRVITGSRLWPRAVRAAQRAAAAGAVPPSSCVEGSDPGSAGDSDYEVFTVVLRAGLSGASTDHKSVCFAVDASSGEIGSGLSNQHWYATGASHVGRVGGSYGVAYESHPDSGARVAGRVIPDFAAIRDLTVRAHAALAPNVPLIGWDVALTPDGPCLLEMNISCNFFNGSYSRDRYVEFAWEHFSALADVAAGRAPVPEVIAAPVRPEPEPAGEEAVGCDTVSDGGASCCSGSECRRRRSSTDSSGVATARQFGLGDRDATAARRVAGLQLNLKSVHSASTLSLASSASVGSTGTDSAAADSARTA